MAAVIFLFFLFTNVIECAITCVNESGATYLRSGMGGDESHLEEIALSGPGDNPGSFRPARTKWGPATIKTLLNRLISKGALHFEKNGKSYLYSPAYTEEEFRAAEADSFLHRIFDGALSPMISHFVRSRRLTPKELDSLEKILRERRKAI
jgi:predicted transcriptional regulator